jgi:hypothetical protein
VRIDVGGVLREGVVNLMPIAARLSAPLQARIHEYFAVHDDLATKHQHVISTHRALIEATGGAPFLPHGYAAWQMIRSTRDMVIIDLCSFAAGLSEPGGFFGQFRGDDLKAVGTKWPTPFEPGPILMVGEVTESREVVEDVIRQHVTALNADARLEAFSRLFPEAAAAQRNVPNGEDIETLKKALKATFERLDDDRNQIRAHRYEKEAKKQTADELSLEDTTEFLNKTSEVIRDVYLLATNAGHSTLNVDMSTVNAEGKDTVDLILLGTMSWIFDGDPGKGHAEDSRYWQRRDAHYRRLREAYDAMGRPERLAFNDPEVSASLASST